MSAMRAACRVMVAALALALAGCAPSGATLDIPWGSITSRGARIAMCSPGPSSQSTRAPGEPQNEKRSTPVLPSTSVCRGYGGSPREPDDVAVVVTINGWRGGSTTVLGVDTLDGQTSGRRPESEGQTDTVVSFPQIPKDRAEWMFGAGGDFEFPPGASGPLAPCRYVALVPGDHAATLRAVCWQSGRHNSSVSGTVQFVAERAGFYSFQVCRSSASGEPVFWVRDERSGACVSRICPNS